MKHLTVFSVLIILLPFGIIGGEWERVALEGIEVSAIDIKTSQNYTEIIVGTNGEGIYKYDDQNSTITPFYTAYLDSFELFIRHVNAIYNRPTNFFFKCYVCTDSGLCYYALLGRDSSHWARYPDVPAVPVTAITGRDDTLFAATRREIYRSVNSDGYTWEALNADSALPEMQKDPCFTSITLNEYGKMSIYAGSMMPIIGISPWSGVLISSNMGETWGVHNGGLVPPVISVYSLCFFKEKFSDTIGYYACGTNKGVFSYRPMALSWTRLKPGILDSQKVNDLFVTTYSNSNIPEIFACTDSGAYLLSAFPQASFEKAEWHWLNFNQKTNCAHAIPQTGGSVDFWFVGTDDGLYKYFREEVSIKKEGKSVKDLMPGITINSCNNQIIIHLNSSIKKATSGYLIDTKGRVIKKIKSVANNTVIFDTNRLTKGIYFLHIKADKNSYTRKINIIDR